MVERDKALEVERNDISNSAPTDYFIYSHFFEKSMCLINSEQIRYAENLSEAALYVRHILLYDILNDLLDDIEYDFKMPFSKKQSDVIAIMNFWFKFGKVSLVSEKQVLQLCDDFNNQFADNDDLRYEIHILNGAEKLKEFLTIKYGTSAEFDENKLKSVCSEEQFDGEELKDFTEKLLGT